ncbi:DUF397 domain-containing protein [Gandjariella thermophila]|uniref:Toxin n=1 Tax=Gandjariella thermophila TaxID=1931992 RepID=A0A4D4JAT3_9PSEU|nr:DUF397 domain-containing protein [Gandjariella thermophila]GDY33771.1 toxin [Gandjariella thermophila]
MVDLADVLWRKSSRSGTHEDNCVEVAFVHPARTWRRSSRSSVANDNCVEVAHASPVVAVRDAKHPGPVLTFPAASWHAFLRAHAR